MTILYIPNNSDRISVPANSVRKYPEDFFRWDINVVQCRAVFFNLMISLIKDNLLSEIFLIFNSSFTDNRINKPLTVSMPSRETDMGFRSFHVSLNPPRRIWENTRKLRGQIMAQPILDRSRRNHCLSVMSKIPEFVIVHIWHPFH